MDLRKIKSSKGLKLLALLISSMFIATVSAAVYSQMFMYSHVTVEGNFVKYISAGNTTYLGGSITPGGEEVTFSNMLARNGSLVTYIEAVNVSNSHASNDYNVTLKHYTWDGEGQYNLRYINVTMYDTADQQKGAMLSLLPGTGDVLTSGKVLLTAANTWRVQWDIFWWANATTANTIDVTLVLEVE